MPPYRLRPQAPPDDTNRFSDGLPAENEASPARPSQPGAGRPEPGKLQPSRFKLDEDGLEGPLGPRDDDAAQIANEVQKLVYNGLNANPELMDKLQRLGILDKLQNRGEMALDLRAKAQDVLDLIPDRFENRFQSAVGKRLGPTYQPLFDDVMDWVRKPLSPQEARQTGRKTQKSWLMRLWNWLWNRSDGESRWHIPFLGKKRREEEEIYF